MDVTKNQHEGRAASLQPTSMTEEVVQVAECTPSGLTAVTVTGNLLPGDMNTLPPATMDVLPEELLAHVLDLLPTKTVFAVMRVSHKWENACRFVVMKRKKLVLYSSDMLVPNEVDEFYGIVLCGMDEDRISKMLVSLKQMRKLAHFRDAADCAEIIAQNSRSLEQIWCSELPDDGSITYPSLKELHCESLTAS